MTPIITDIIAQWPVLLAIAVVYILHRQDFKLIEQKIDGLNKRFDDLKESINARFDDQKESFNARFDDINARFDDQKENINARFDDQKENINARFDDQKESFNKRLDDQSRTLNTLGQKVDTVSGQVHRIEGHLHLPRTGTDG
ncbi:MAG: DUF2852 domain-containing protein [Gammaproteobacteria bacterium]|nr:DUF2852 domain-containing protein [Gammaproteobacteria bacterium]MCY4337808.1 DUF2852 domain-containing protein [Gammaproteobacteria bacterium]